jgi:hypothetical protein
MLRLSQQRLSCKERLLNICEDMFTYILLSYIYLHILELNILNENRVLEFRKQQDGYY